MRIAFNIARLAQFRLLGPVIDRALELGWYVECWCDHTGPRDGLKGYLFPATEAVPRFQHGLPVVRTYRDQQEFADGLERSHIDAVVSADALQPDTHRTSQTKHPVRICVQSLLDTFVNHSLKALGSYDLVALQTPWWANWAAFYYEVTTGSSDAAVLQALLTQRTAHVGSPELDARRLVDRDEVLRRWNIPRDQPVVLLLPFPQGVGAASFWPKKIFGETSRGHRLLNVLVHRQFRYWRRAFSDPTNEDVVRAVRAFCDRNGAFLLVKSRVKTAVPDYTQALADKCVYDESYYPPTIIEALSIADLCVSHYSSSVLEAASVSVPHVCITFSAPDYLGRQADATALFERYFNRDEGGVFQFEGVSSTVTVEEAIRELPGRSLSDFVVDPDARRAYLHRYIGEDDYQAASRLVDAITAVIDSRRIAHGDRPCMATPSNTSIARRNGLR